MDPQKRTSHPNPMGPDEALKELLAMSLDERLDAVARDVRRRSCRYSCISGHDLAEALGVDTEGPWEGIYYAEIVSVETHAQENAPASEFVYLIEDSVDPERFQRLLELSKPLDEEKMPQFSFLRKSERRDLERAIAEQKLQGNMEDGMCCISRFSLESPSGVELEFEAYLECDGTCIDLLTPYDKRAKRFVNLKRCVTSDAW